MNRTAALPLLFFAGGSILLTSCTFKDQQDYYVEGEASIEPDLAASARLDSRIKSHFIDVNKKQTSNNHK